MCWAKRILPHRSPVVEDLCDKQKTVELHSCLKTLVADNSPELLRLSHPFTPQYLQDALFSILDFQESI